MKYTHIYVYTWKYLVLFLLTLRKNFTFPKKRKEKRERKKERQKESVRSVFFKSVLEHVLRTYTEKSGVRRSSRVIILDSQRHLPTTFSHTRNFSRQDPILNTSENHVEQILDLHPSGTLILCVSTEYSRLIQCGLEVLQRDFAAISYAACKCAK